MKVTIKFFASLREIAGKKEEVLNLDDGSLVEDLIKILIDKYGPEFKYYVYDEKKSSLKQDIQFLLNGRNVLTLNGLKTKLQDGDQVAILPPVGGGE
ncbi:MAG: ubiquitin-like small modifier protein 1 [Candidatus Bathyarchaeia archaeon]